MGSLVIVTDVMFLLSHKEMCQHFDYLHYSVSQYIPNDQRKVLQSHRWVNDREFKKNGFYYNRVQKVHWSNSDATVCNYYYKLNLMKMCKIIRSLDFYAETSAITVCLHFLHTVVAYFAYYTTIHLDFFLSTMHVPWWSFPVSKWGALSFLHFAVASLWSYSCPLFVATWFVSHLWLLSMAL